MVAAVGGGAGGGGGGGGVQEEEEEVQEEEEVGTEVLRRCGGWNPWRTAGLCMYVCVYVCMYIRTYVCIHTYTLDEILGGRQDCASVRT